MRYLYALPLVLATFAPAANAQILSGADPDSSIRDGHLSNFERRSSGGIGFTQTRPLGGLQKNIGFGYGGTGNYVFKLDHRGIAGLRIGGSVSGYGQERMRVPLSYTVGGRVQVDVTTTNTIGTLTLGPELMFPTGPIRPYVHGGVGVVWFATTSSVQGINNFDNEFETRNFNDGTATWAAGGGVHIPLARKRTAVLLDLGADYFYGGDASYLRKGSIVDLPGGQIRINSYHSETRFVNVTLGVRVTP